MRRSLLALPILVLALAGTTPAHALDYRVCTINDDDPSQTNYIVFTYNDFTSGSWQWTIGGRRCIGNTGAPANLILSGTYAGNPCLSTVLTGDVIGVVTPGVAGTAVAVTHAGPHTTYYAIDGVHVLRFGGCNPDGGNFAVVDTVQVHLLP